MIIVDNRTNYDIKLDILEQIASKLTNKEIELIFVDNAAIKELNKNFRNINEPTDVLSFPLKDIPNVPLGTIIISLEYAKNKADELGHTLNDEVALLFIHGLLHLLGFDHEKDNGEMRAKELELITIFNLPTSLIIRSEIESN